MTKPTPSEFLFGRIILFFVGICCFVIIAVGSIGTLNVQKHGVKAQGEVLEIVLDHHYRTTNYKRNEDFYRLKVGFANEQGVQETRWVIVNPSEKKAMKLVIGSRVPLVYVPGSDQGMIASEVPTLRDALLPCALFLSLGILFIGLAVFVRMK